VDDPCKPVFLVEQKHAGKTNDGVPKAPRHFHLSLCCCYFRLGEGELGAGAGREGDGREGLVRDGELFDGETFREGAGWPGLSVREGGVLRSGRAWGCSFRDRLKSITR